MPGTVSRPSHEDLYRDAVKVLPGGVSRNTIFRHPHPLYVEHAEGCVVTDITGVRRLDFANNMCSLIHGHAHPAIVEAVTAQIRKGTAFTLGTEIEVRYAEYLCERGGFDKIRFVNSGTEAVMAMIKVARAFTGRAKIAKAEGAYHGLYDYAEVSQTSGPSTWGDIDHPARVPVARGTPQGVLDDVVVIPFNDTERSLQILRRHAGTIACVLIDPMPHRIGFFPATHEFVAALHEWTRKDGALLAFDEVITFRCEYGGAQQWFPVRPDLVAMGKIIGGGFPVGAVAGRDDVMKVLDPSDGKPLVPHSGTFSANPVTLTAGKVAMELFDEPAVTRLNELGDHARSQVWEAIRVADIPASVTGAGSLLRVHLGKPTPPRGYREALPDAETTKILKAMLDYALDNGIILINTGSVALSTPMTGAEIDRLSEVLLGAFRAIKPRLSARE